jgi:D-arabinose 1-dehydrogenase-like Zn-dependent alcohol dehydrogenase
MFFLQKNLVGSTMGTLAELRDLLDFVATTGISPEIGQELPMTEATDGFRSMLDGETAGKIVFTR